MLLKAGEMEIAQGTHSKEGRFKISGAAGSTYGEHWGKSQAKQQAHSTGGTGRLLKPGSKCGPRFPV